MTRTAALLLTLAAIPVFSAAAWHHPLYLGNGGIWKQRIAIEVRNDADLEAKGDGVAVPIGAGDGAADLAGYPADALRVCNGEGVEMLWAVTGPNGKPVRRGPIPEGGSLTVPVECAAQGSATYYAYFDNADAWAVPDFLDARGGLRNGNLEEGEGEAPEGWSHDANDEQHRTFWTTEAPHSEMKCLKTVVAPGAEETWIATRQVGLQIVGGARYVMTAWVKAEDVKGFCGWYIHLGNDQNYMIDSPMLNAGAGTFDWKEVRAEFTAPKDATRSDLGTVLRGTGTAWFDDLTLTCLDENAAKLTARAGKPEKLGLAQVGADAPWPQGGKWAYRVPVRVTNLTEKATSSGLISVDMSGVASRLVGRVDPEALQVMDGDKAVNSYRLRDVLLLEGETPAKTIKTYYLYMAAGGRGRGQDYGRGRNAAPTGAEGYAANPALPGGTEDRGRNAVPTGDYEALLDSPRNLVKNGSFEAGEALPDAWPGGAEGEKPADTKMGCDEPGLFGKRCLKMDIPKTSTASWTGWRQDVPIEVGRSYLYAAWVKCANLSGGLQLHAHRRTAAGELIKGDSMVGAGPAITDTTDWTLISGVFDMPDPETRIFQLHLTMLATGTAWHDGALLVEVAAGEVGKLQSGPVAPAAGTVGGGIAAWAVNPIVKVFQDDIPPADVTEVRITCARNEREPLQIAVRGTTAVKGVKVEVEGLNLPTTVGVVGYVPIDHATNYYSLTTPTYYRKFPTSPGACDGFPGMWPDPILPRDSFDLAADQTQPVWVTVSVPKDAAPGDYRGTVRLTADGKLLKEVPFTVRVWGFTLPDESHVKAIYDCRQGGDVWSVPGKTPQQWREDMWRFMAERRVCPDTVQPGPSISFVDGKAVCDFAAFDAAAAVYFDELKMPHTYTPWNFYCFGWGFPPGEKFGHQPYEGTYPFEGTDRTKLRPEFKQAYQACLKAYWDHMKAKGWADKVTLYISDEPFDGQKPIVDQMKALCDMIHEVDPSIPIYCSTWHHQPEWDGYLDVWGIGHYGIVPVEKIRDLTEDATVWWTTDGQMCTDTPYCAVERLLPHYCFKYGAKAYEFWGVDWLTYDPYEFGWHSYIYQSDTPGKSYYVRYPNGDGFLAYPGKPIGHPGPVTSVRLEAAREGVEDYEYLYLLKDLVAKAKAAGRDASEGERALALADELVAIPNAGGRYSTKILPDPGKVLVVKEAVGKAVEGLGR